MDHVDLLQIHDPDPNTAIEESWKAVQHLVREGKVRHGGLSNHPVELVRRAMSIGPVVSNQLQYNPLERGIEKELMPFCEENNIGILSWGSLAEGFLTDNFDLNALDSKDFRRGHKYGQAENSKLIMLVRDAFNRVAARHAKTMVDVVIAWELMHSALTGVIIGVRNEKESEQMTQATGLHLAKEDVREIEQALAIWNTKRE